MEKTTYLAPNLMDWVAQIKAGAATVKVHFTGGALTSYGVTPAEYTTTNPFIQKVIENSTYYKEGRIKKGRTVHIPDPVKKAEVKKPEVKEPEIKEPEIKEPKLESAATTLTTVEVTCLQDAHGYLQEHYGIASYKVRSYAAAQKAAEEHGVTFVGAGFGGETANEEEIANEREGTDEA